MSFRPLVLELVDSASRNINAVQYETSIYVDNSGEAYVGYVDGGVHPCLAWRLGPSQPWSKINLWSGGQPDDSHNLVAVGKSSDGHVHVAWNMHNSPLLHYKRTTTPGDINSLGNLVMTPMGGTLLSSLSYPRFYSAGSELYFVARTGTSGAGDVFVKRYLGGDWFDLAVPMIIGNMSGMLTDSPYLGQCWGTPEGDLWFVWTHRVNESTGPVNYGVFCVRFDAITSTWRDVAGNTLALPLSRFTAAATVVNISEATIGSSSLCVAVDGVGPHLAWTAASGHREVYHAVYDGGWTIRQVSNFGLPRYHVCPSPISVTPSACDLEIQGPSMIYYDGRLALFYGRTVAASLDPATYARPSAIIYESASINRGESFITREVIRPLESMLGELPRGTGDVPAMLLQTVVNSVGSLHLAEFVSPTVKIGGVFPYAELSNTPSWEGSAISISAWVRPINTLTPMAVTDKGGLAGNREVRMLIWGNNTGGSLLAYDENRLQILIGNSTGGWGLVWYPQVFVPANCDTHLLLAWDGTIARLYVNGVIVATTLYQGSIKSGTSRVLVGASRSAVGAPEYFYSGVLDVEVFDRSLDAQVAADLYAVGWNK